MGPERRPGGRLPQIRGDAAAGAFMAALEEAMAAAAPRTPALRHEGTLYPTVSPAVVKQTLDCRLRTPSRRRTPNQPTTQTQWGNLRQFLRTSGQLRKPHTPREGVDWTNAFLRAAR